MRILILLFISFIISACGADKLKNTQLVNSLASSTTDGETVSCLCTSDYSPVCGADKKDYDNACLAKCIGKNTIYKAGHCVCSNSRIVCGDDGRDYAECDALAAKVKIVDYISCTNSSL